MIRSFFVLCFSKSIHASPHFNRFEVSWLPQPALTTMSMRHVNASAPPSADPRTAVRDTTRVSASWPHLKATKQRPVCAMVRHRDTTVMNLFDEWKTVTDCSSHGHTFPRSSAEGSRRKQVTCCWKTSPVDGPALRSPGWPLVIFAVAQVCVHYDKKSCDVIPASGSTEAGPKCGICQAPDLRARLEGFALLERIAQR